MIKLMMKYYYFLLVNHQNFLFSLFIIFAYFYSALSISEVFEDYINNEKLKMSQINCFIFLL